MSEGLSVNVKSLTRYTLLASGSRHDSTFTIWDVAQGTGTPLRRGFGGISLLKWSPMGDYFVSANMSGVFHLWETSKWMSAPWSSAGGSVVVMPYTYARDSVDVVSSMFSILLFLCLDVHISHMS
jgi:WD40 repeat protein